MVVDHQNVEEFNILGGEVRWLDIQDLPADCAEEKD